MITNRAWSRGRFKGTEAAEHALSFVELRPSGPIKRIAWPRFRNSLLRRLQGLACAHERPLIIVPVHGYNNDWDGSVRFVGMVDSQITSQVEGALTVGFSWPSAGNTVRYVGDRARARSSAIAFASALSEAMRMLRDERCPAEIIVIAHSMGNYMISKAAEYASEAHGDPKVHVFAETLMVAADVDGNCFEVGGVSRQLALLSRRVTAYRSVHDAAILASRAKRANVTGPRLGRQGVNDLSAIPPNVAVVDASEQTADVGWGVEAHSDHFASPGVVADMIAVIKGVDRTAIPGRRERESGEFEI